MTGVPARFAWWRETERGFGSLGCAEPAPCGTRFTMGRVMRSWSESGGDVDVVVVGGEEESAGREADEVARSGGARWPGDGEGALLSESADDDAEADAEGESDAGEAWDGGDSSS